MLRKRKIKRHRLNGNKARRILQIHRLKRRISERRRVGLMVFQAQ